MPPYMSSTPPTPDYPPEDVPVRQVPVPCRQAPELFFPDIDAATRRQKRILRRKVLPLIAAACDQCFFRVPCAIAALENQETAGVWAGVLVRHYDSPDTWHRKKLLAILAEHITTAAPTPENKKLNDRISAMLSRRPELQPGFTEAVHAARTKKSQESATPEPEKTAQAPFMQHTQIMQNNSRKRWLLPHPRQLELFTTPIPA